MYEREMGGKKEIKKSHDPCSIILLFLCVCGFPLIPSFLTGKREAELPELLKTPLTALSIRGAILWQHNGLVYC